MSDKDPQPTQLKFEPSEKQPTERREFWIRPNIDELSEPKNSDWSEFVEYYQKYPNWIHVREVLPGDKDEYQRGYDDCFFDKGLVKKSLLEKFEVIPAEDIRPLLEALKMRVCHDDDCADSNEEFANEETCECGAAAAQNAVAAFYAKHPGVK